MAQVSDYIGTVSYNLFLRWKTFEQIDCVSFVTPYKWMTKLLTWERVKTDNWRLHARATDAAFQRLARFFKASDL